MMGWWYRFLDWLLPQVKPISIGPRTYPRTITLVGGPAAGMKIRHSRLKIGSTIKIPLATKMSISTSFLPTLPRFHGAEYVVESYRLAVWKGNTE